MKRSSMILILLTIGIIIPTFAQKSINKFASSEIRKLNIGDKVPDIILKDIINFKGNPSLHDFRGKLLILDFWGLECAPCIASFQKMSLLQDQFKGKLQVILVNTINSVDYLTNAGFPGKTKIKPLNETKLPFIVGMPEMKELFPHGGEPYFAWIDTAGIVIGFTRRDDVTSENIDRAIKGQPLKTIQVKRYEDMDLKQSFLRPSNDNILDNILYSSVITRNPQVHGLGDEIYDTSTHQLIGTRFTDIAYKMLEIAARIKLKRRGIKSMPPLEENRVVSEIRNAHHPYSQSLQKLYTDDFAYECMIPPIYNRPKVKKDERRKIIDRLTQEDIERFFMLKVDIEKRWIKCWVVRRTSEKDLVKTRIVDSPSNPVANRQTYVDSDGNFHIENLFFYCLPNALSFSQLKTESFPHPILDETGFSTDKRVDIIIKGGLNQPIEKINLELKRYGLDIEEELRFMDVLVLRDYDIEYTQ